MFGPLSKTHQTPNLAMWTWPCDGFKPGGNMIVFGAWMKEGNREAVDAECPWTCQHRWRGSWLQNSGVIWWVTHPSSRAVLVLCSGLFWPSWLLRRIQRGEPLTQSQGLTVSGFWCQNSCGQEPLSRASEALGLDCLKISTELKSHRDGPQHRTGLVAACWGGSLRYYN